MTTNSVTALGTHVDVLRAVALPMGASLLWALLYAGTVERMLPGPGWCKGLLFALGPCLFALFALFAVLPALSTDPFGTVTGTGPLAGLGVLLLHAVYGLVLGTVYGLTQGDGTPGGMESRQAMVSTQVAWHLTLGLVLGAVISVVASLALTGIYLTFANPTFLKPTDPMLLEIIVGAPMGAFAGIVLGVPHALSSSSHHGAGY